MGDMQNAPDLTREKTDIAILPRGATSIVMAFHNFGSSIDSKVPVAGSVG